MKHIQIAIDGPAGAGKSTIAKLIAKNLNFIYIDTGAMYRAITLKAMDLNVDLHDEKSFDFVKNTKFIFKNGQLHMDGIDVSHKIRETKVSNHVSLVSSYFSVRQNLVKMQHSMANSHSVVMDGRDIGYKVLPNADYKFFLTASIKQRAKRRHLDNLERKIASDIFTIEIEIERRDYLDTTREHSPLKAADDAIMVDTSELNIEQVVKLITQRVREEE
ncbi:MAG: (d)CMP kinase [Candidatus Izimaplasma sp.]|nr:(d)CMP kinase [Candidatus Izimaplasma bacterium]